MRGLIPCLLAVLVSSCKISEKDHEAGVAQEVGSLWTLVAHDPPTYVPKGYPAGAPRSEKRCNWVTSNRDKRKFYIPPEGMGEGEVAALRRSALRAIDPFDKSKEVTVGDLTKTVGEAAAMAPLLALPVYVPPEFVRGNPE